LPNPQGKAAPKE